MKGSQNEMSTKWKGLRVKGSWDNRLKAMKGLQNERFMEWKVYGWKTIHLERKECCSDVQNFHLVFILYPFFGKREEICGCCKKLKGGKRKKVFSNKEKNSILNYWHSSSTQQESCEVSCRILRSRPVSSWVSVHELLSSKDSMERLPGWNMIWYACSTLD